MGIPYAHDQTAFPFAKPVCHDAHHTRPARGLEHPACNLDEQEVPDAVEVEAESYAEKHGEEAREEHTDGEEEAEVHALCHKTAEKHEECIGEEIAGVKEAEVGLGFLFRFSVYLRNP